MKSPGYLRFPHIANDLVVFVAADDVWLAPLPGGRAWRFTADEAWAATPRLTPDGTQVAWVSAKDGSAEVYAASLAGGTSTRLTYWGKSWARVSGWTPAGEVLAVSAANQPFLNYVRARVLTTVLSGSPGAERVLPFGLVSDLSLGAGGDGTGGGTAAPGDGWADTIGLLTGTWGSFQTEPVNWKRYRGGTAGRLWVGPATAIVPDPPGAAGRVPGRFQRVLADLPAQFASPMIVGGRLAFIADHEGTGNIYSCALDGSDLRRHTDHEGWYARQASTDGQRIVYARGGELWLLDDLQAAGPVRLDITLGSPVRGRAPRLVTAEDHVGSLSVDRGGRASSIEVRGTVHWLTHRDGPARAVSVVPGVRARFPQVLGTGGQVVWAADAGGSDGLEVGSGDPACPADPVGTPRRIAAGQVGRITGLAAAPDGTMVAVAAQDGRLRVVDVESGQVREIAASDNGVVTGLAWSPDAAWLAWSQPAEHPAGINLNPLRRLRLARVADGQVFDVTDGRFADTEPAFTLDGKYLAFLSKRDFDPVYDAHFFNLAFPYGARPYLLPLDGTTPSPFGPELGGRPIGEPAGKRAGGPAAGGESASAGDTADAAVGGDSPHVPPVPVETSRMADRIVALPVPEARYSGLRAVKDGMAWLREPVTGSLGIGGAHPADDAPRPVLERFDFVRREVSELAREVDWFEASGDGTRLVTSDHGKLTVIPAERNAADADNPDDKVEIDRSRARFLLDPPAMWRQAYAEAGRIMRHDFWVPDMADVDWDAMQDEYRPLLDRITTESEFIDVLWELFGELGTSHAYAYPPGGGTPTGELGLLGADIERSGDAWRLTRVVHGDTSDPRARAPLAAPGAGIAAGDMLLAVDGRPVGPAGPGPLLMGAAGKPVELTIAPADGSPARSVPVVPLRGDTRLRYLDWVSAKRAQVRELSGGRIGYLHVPDMVSQGWADFHRDLRTEMLRDALVVDVRGNTGGFTSELVVEKLARRVIGWTVPSAEMPYTYPQDAPRGPVVAITDECSGSDGDIVTAAIRLLRLGPVVGARTWGGVLGFDSEHELVDGTQITVPRLACWFEEYGWGIENHGVDPDVEVIMSPDDWAAERDTQLETAVRLALEALQQRPAVQPPDTRTRPSRRRPPLPPRP
ncbi:MAG TPA: S41 family peptidase [Streptosporangiaceae bacterium]|nr:S41 family peptidase [Streptosporangiaceae bacterium]